MGFSASSYLASQGWAGPGTGFTTKSRKKPITLPQKKNLLGIGSDRDTSNPWWDNLFNQVANKLDQPKQQQQQQQQSELYRHFQRGNIIPGTNTLESICNQQSTSSTTQQQQEKTDPVVKKKRSNSTLHKSDKKEKKRTVPQEQEEEENSAQTETDKKKKKKKRRSLHPSTPSSNVNIEEGPPKKQKTK